MIGKTLNQYKIVGPLGAGGMGRVYRARDTKLDRDVAIKVLPDDFSNDAARIIRFKQEAKMLASVNHGNIAAVYGLEVAEGIRYLAQELVEGKTLAKLLKTRPLDTGEALDICRQVASALEAAHERQLIHRDLKPSNVMVTLEGAVKVLDFGLAKPVEVESTSGGPTLELTDPQSHSLAETKEGVLLGTAAYMSPDQARGRPLDARTDIWSFGCVVYESLTGRIAFKGDTIVDTLAAVLKGEPDWEALPPDLPWKIRDLTRRCLQKDARRRFQHIGDARIEIEEALAEPLEVTEAVASVAAAPATLRQRAFPWAMAAVAALSIGVAAWSVLSSTSRPSAEVVNAALTLPDGELVAVAPAASLALSPDGRTVAYVAGSRDSRQLYKRSLDSSRGVPIPDTAGATSPFFSPDGEWVGFFSGDKKLKKISLAGAAPVAICDVPVGNSGATWGPDGSIIYATAFTSTGLWQVPADGGEPRPLTIPNIEEDEISHEWPHFLPDGEGVLFSVSTAEGSNVAVLSLETGEWRILLQGTAEARYLPTGHLIYAQSGELLVVPFDLESREIRGAPISVIDEVYTSVRANRAFFDVSDNGTLVYVPGDVPQGRQTLVWVDRQGNVTPAVEEYSRYGHPQLSPDGTRVAFDGGSGELEHVWVYDLERGTRSRVTFEGTNGLPVWSEGEVIIFASTRTGVADLYAKRADGGGTANLLWTSTVAKWPRSWSQEARALAYYELHALSGRDIWVLQLDKSGSALPFVATTFNERAPIFSRDGRWIAYISDESGRDEVYVQSYPDPVGRFLVSTGGGTEPVWSVDGTELFYRDGDKMMRVEVQTGSSFRAGTPELLFEGRFARDSIAHNQYYDVAADGRFLMIRQDRDEGSDHLHLVVNWFAQLRDMLRTGVGP